MKKHKSAVMQMYYGEKGNFESVKGSPCEGELITVIEDNYKLLYDKIKSNDELLNLFNAYKNGLENLQIFETEKYYAEGFKFGLLMGVEAGQS